MCSLSLLHTWQGRLSGGLLVAMRSGRHWMPGTACQYLDDDSALWCKGSLKEGRYFADPVLCTVNRALRATAGLQVIPSRGVKVAGLLGPASPTDRKGTSFSDTPVGIGGTTQWKLAGLVCCRRSMPCVCHSLVLVEGSCHNERA